MIPPNMYHSLKVVEGMAENGCCNKIPLVKGEIVLLHKLFDGEEVVRI